MAGQVASGIAEIHSHDLAWLISTSMQEIGFGFVSCSCRACEREGEAKLCGRVRGECLSTLMYTNTTSISDQIRTCEWLALPTRTPLIVDTMPPPAASDDVEVYDMHVFVQLPFGQTIQWMAGDQASIEGIKSVIEARFGIPVDQQRLLVEAPNGRSVSDPVNVTNDEVRFILLPFYQEPPPRKRKREMEEEEEE